MNKQREQLKNELFDAALELAPIERVAFLRKAAGDDKEIIGEVRAWLWQADRGDLMSPLIDGEASCGTPAEVDRPRLKCPKCGQFSLRVSEQAEAFICEDSACSNSLKLRPEAETPPVLAKVSSFEIIGLLGQGGCGRVWFARDSVNGQYVALKIPFNACDKDKADAFIRETRRAYELLSDPRAKKRIPSLVSAGEDGGVPYIAFEFINARPLSDLIANRSHELNVRKCAEITFEIATTLQIAHNNNFVHRDVKPSNVLVTHDGQVYLTDFGISKDMVSLCSDQTETETEFSGTVRYASPEHVNGGLDPRSDVFSLGIVLFELVSGQHPFPNGNMLAQLGSIADIKQEAAQLSELVPGVDPAIDEICARCLRKRKSERYTSAGELANSLADFLSQASSELPSKAPDDQSVQSINISLSKAIPTWLAFMGSSPAVGAMIGLLAITTAVVAIKFRYQSNIGLPHASEAIGRLEARSDLQDLVKIRDGWKVELWPDTTEELLADLTNNTEAISELVIHKRLENIPAGFSSLADFAELQRVKIVDSTLSRADIQDLIQLQTLDEVRVENVGIHESFANASYYVHELITEFVNTNRARNSTYRIPLTFIRQEGIVGTSNSIPIIAATFAGEQVDDSYLREKWIKRNSELLNCSEIWLFATNISLSESLDFSGLKKLKKLVIYANRSLGVKVGDMRLPDGLETLIVGDHFTQDNDRSNARMRIKDRSFPASLVRLDLNSFGRFNAVDLSFLSSLSKLEALRVDSIELSPETIDLLEHSGSLQEVVVLTLSKDEVDLLRRERAGFTVYSVTGDVSYTPESSAEN